LAFTYPVSCTTTYFGPIPSDSCRNFLGISTSSTPDNDEFIYWLIAAAVGTPLFIVIAIVVRSLRRS
jgi:hypothetical protein